MNPKFKMFRLICTCDMCSSDKSQRCIMLRGPHGSVRICQRHLEAMAWSLIRRSA